MLILFSEKPEILPISFDSTLFLEGDLAQSNCVLKKGDKPLHIHWHFNGHRLRNSESVQILRMGRSSILTIDPVRGMNQGKYSCVASNSAGRMAVHTNLVVNGTFLMFP